MRTYEQIHSLSPRGMHLATALKEGEPRLSQLRINFGSDRVMGMHLFEELGDAYRLGWRFRFSTTQAGQRRTDYLEWSVGMWPQAKAHVPPMYHLTVCLISRSTFEAQFHQSETVQRRLRQLVERARRHPDVTRKLSRRLRVVDYVIANYEQYTTDLQIDDLLTLIPPSRPTREPQSCSVRLPDGLPVERPNASGKRWTELQSRSDRAHPAELPADFRCFKN